MGKFIMRGFGPLEGAWLRYTSALLAYCVFVLVARRFRPGKDLFRQPFMMPANAKDAALLFLLGFMSSCFSPWLQMSGLSSSHASDNALIIALEPMMTVLIAWIFLGERLTRAHLVAFGLALVGFALLAGLTPAGLANGWNSHLTGNLVLLLSLTGEALYSTLGRKLIVRYPPMAVFGSALAVGVFCQTLGSGVMGTLPSYSQLASAPWSSILGVLWTGPLGTAMTYLFWMMALPSAPVASLALTVFVQPILGPVWGAIFLDERLTLTQLFGSIMILAAVFGQSWVERRSADVAPKV